MILNILLILCAMTISALCGFVAIPVILDYCKARNLYDIPNARKIHHTLIPRLGGIAFMPSMFLAFIIAVFLLGKEYQGQGIQVSLWSLNLFISLALIYSVGIIDDLFGLQPNIKFIVQIIAAAILPLSGLYVNNMAGLFGLHAISYWVGTALTIFIIVFICNAMNLIDGIDGLCASLTEIALCGFLYVFFVQKLYIYCILIGGLMGVLIPYLYFNIFGNAEKNRKIFMGDSGSLTLGFILGFLFVKIAMDNPNVKTFRTEHIVLAYSMLIVPTFDAVRVSIHRIIRHQSPFQADKNHIHHKLIRAGLSMHQSLIIITALNIAFIAINLLLYSPIGFTGIFFLDIVLYTLFQIVINAACKRKGVQKI